MAKKKSIEDRQAEIINLQKMLEEAKKNEVKERESLAVRVFSPVFSNAEVCSFCDKNQRSKQIMDYIKEEVEKAILSVIEAVNTGKIKCDTETEETELKAKEKEDTSAEEETEEESEK